MFVECDEGLKKGEEREGGRMTRAKRWRPGKTTNLMEVEDDEYLYN